MINSALLQKLPLTAGIGLCAGALFTWIMGNLDVAHYVVELMSISPLEIPFIVLAAVLVRKFTWFMGLVYILVGTAASFYMIFPNVSITSVVFLQTAVMGVFIGETKWFSRNFTWRLSAVSFPGFVLAVIFGLQLVLSGIPAGTIDEIRQESLEMYQVFMSQDDALNAVENAMLLFKTFFRMGFGILFLGALILSWLSFHVARWIMVRFREEPEAVPPIYFFKIPFHAIWIFLVGLGVYLIGYKPLFLIAINILFIMAGLYGIQGLAVVTYHMNRISLGIWPRIFFWLIFFITLTFSFFILIITGIVDNWINLRSLPFFSKTIGQEEGNKNESDS